jgi:hypothetical protein
MNEEKTKKLYTIIIQIMMNMVVVSFALIVGFGSLTATILFIIKCAKWLGWL